MSNQLVVYGFETSNNMKVRVGLGYKDLDYEWHAIDPADRSKILELSGQFLTPLVVHGKTVLFDSAAILRYLDANFQDTPKLFGSDRQTTWAIEAWERFGRGNLHEPLMAVVQMRLTGSEDPQSVDLAAEEFNCAVEHLDRELEGKAWLVGDAMTAADVTCAAVVYRATVDQAIAQQYFRLPPGSKGVQEWCARVMAYDRSLG